MWNFCHHFKARDSIGVETLSNIQKTVLFCKQVGFFLKCLGTLKGFITCIYSFILSDLLSLRLAFMESTFFNLKRINFTLFSPPTPSTALHLFFFNYYCEHAHSHMPTQPARSF